MSKKQISIWPSKTLGQFIITHNDIIKLKELGIEVWLRDPQGAANPQKVNNE